MHDETRPVVVDAVNFSEVFRFHRILRAVGMGFQPPRLMIALFMVAALMTGGMVWDWIAGPTFSTYGLSAGAAVEGQGVGPFEASVSHVVAGFNRLIQGVVYLELPTVFAAVRSLFVVLPTELWRHAPWFLICYGVFFVVVTAIGGGALARMTAVEFAGRPRMRAGEALQFAAGQWWKLAFAPLMPLVLAAALALLLAVLGWFFMLRGVDLLGGPLYGLAVAVGLIIAFLLIVYALGAMMLQPAVAVENCDPADALQRAYAYVLARPLHLLGYGLTALAGLTLGYLVAALFVATALNLTASLVGSWANDSLMVQAGGFEVFNLKPRGTASEVARAAESLGWDQRWAAGWIRCWQTILVGLVAAYVYSYLYAAATIVYLLMRRASDGQHETEIWQPGPYAAVPASPAAAGTGTGGGDLPQL